MTTPPLLPDSGSLCAPEQIALPVVGFLLATALIALADGERGARRAQASVAALSLALGGAILACSQPVLAGSVPVAATGLGLAVLLGAALRMLNGPAGLTLRIPPVAGGLAGLVGASWALGGLGWALYDPLPQLRALAIAPYGVLALPASLSALGAVRRATPGAGWTLLATLAWAAAALAALAHPLALASTRPEASVALLALAAPCLYLAIGTRHRARQAARAQDAMARETERQRDEHARFFDLLAHGLRSPLGVLLVGLAALKRSADADRDGRRIERLSAAALHIDTLIDRHDCLYRLTRPGFVPALAPCWHDAPALSALQRQRQLNPQRVFEHGERAPDDEQVLLDPELVTLALCDLLDNAARHASGASAVRLETAAEGGCIHYRVINHGAPLPSLFADLRPRFRLPSKAGDAPEARFGVGLTLAAHVAHAHGGTLSGDCSASLTTVTLTLPLRRPA